MISIIIPALNEEKYIESTLKAIKNQEFKGRYEIIVADNGSKDKTVKIAKKYADKIVRVNKAAHGPAASRNGGAKVAKGKILVFIDADTSPTNNYLTTVKKIFKDKSVIAATSPVLPDKYDVKLLIGCITLNEFLLKGSNKFKRSVLIGNNLVCRKDVFDKVRGFNENSVGAEDIEFSLRLSKIKGKIKFMESTFVITSSRRYKKWGAIKLIKTWPFGYLKLKYFGDSISYDPVR